MTHDTQNIIHIFSKIRTTFFLPFILFCVFCSVIAPSATAQIVPTTRIELTDTSEAVNIGSYLYVTPDPQSNISYQDIITRHKKNIRGIRQNQDIVPLKSGHQKHWMIFSVTNHTDQKDWILDFGEMYEGRTGFLRSLFIRNYTLQKTYVSAHQNDGTSDIFHNIGHNSARIALAPGKTNLIALAIETSGNTGNNIHPTLRNANQHSPLADVADIFSDFTAMFLMIMAGFFLAVSYIRENPNYLVFSAFYILSGGTFIILNHSFSPNIFVNPYLADLLWFASLLSATFATKGFLKLGKEDDMDSRLCTIILGILGAAFLIKILFAHYHILIGLFLFAIPVSLSFMMLAYISYNQSKYGRFGAIFLCIAWIFPTLGLLLGHLSINGIIPTHAWSMNAYWISLFGHAGFFVAATIQKVQMLDEEERQSYIYKSKKALQKVKNIQERESADQAKLLRVIERERELMTGLRELEIHRAEEMRRAKEEADDANRAKSAFLAVVSHEVRTPMTGILGMVRLLLGSKLNSEQKEFVLALQKSGETMMALLNDILDFEKIETGNMELEYVDFDLPQLVKDIVTLMSGHATEKNITLEYQVEDGCPPYVLGDPTRLRQVLLNLVNNAIKFTPEGGVTVILRAKPVDQSASGVRGDYEIYCAVQDTGIGISEEAQKALFDPFSQADNSIARKYGGTGLGLAISKKLIEAMGSTICLESATGEGSTFHFTLLMEKGSADLAHNTDTQQEDKAPLPTKRILVVEDNEMNRKVLQGLLERLGQITAMAESGGDAIDQCKENAFDIIFMDIQLPDMTGVEVTKTLRQLTAHNTDKTPIIALTGNVMLDDIKKYYEATMNGFLAKPIDHDKLYETILNIHNGKLDNPFIDNSPSTPDTKTIESIHNEIETLQTEKPKVPLDLEIEDSPVTDPIDIEEEQAPMPDVPSPAKTDLLDYEILDSLLSNLGKEQCEGLMKGFLEKSDELVDLLGTLTPHNDLNTINERAHELKGMAANFGMKTLSAIAAHIEKSAKENNTETITEKIKELPACNEESKTELLGWLSQA